MTGTRRYLVGAILAAAVIFATAAAAMAQTCTLALKRRETKSASSYSDPTDYMYWAVHPQHFYVQMSAEGKGRPRPTISGDKSQADAFKRIVKKEPKYQSENPFRGVLKLGSQEYAFALDVAAAAPAPEVKKPDAKQTAAKAAAEPAANADALSSLGKLLGLFSGEEPAAKPAIPVKDLSYNRLYFDFNHNGDLTDDKVVEVSADSSRFAPISSPGTSYLRFEFPRTDVTIDVEGTKLDYSFTWKDMPIPPRVLARCRSPSARPYAAKATLPCRASGITSSCSTITAMGVSAIKSRFPRTSTRPEGDCIPSKAICC